jgi:chromosome segregation ATPase
MDEAVTLVSILTETAPLVLALIMFALMLLMVLYTTIRVIIPMLREMFMAAEAQRQAWKAIVEEQNKIHARLVVDLEGDLAEECKEREALAKRMTELEAALEAKNAQISRLEAELTELKAEAAQQKAEIDKLRKDNEAKDKVIAALKQQLDEMKADRDKLQAERDEFKERLDKLEKAQQAATKSDGGTKT